MAKKYDGRPVVCWMKPEFEAMLKMYAAARGKRNLSATIRRLLVVGMAAEQSKV